MLLVDVLSPEGLFGFPHHSLGVTSVYLLHKNHPPYHSIPPEHLFSFLSYLHLILGNFNLHHPLEDPGGSLSTRYLDVAFDIPYHLLKTPGVDTCFPFDTISRPSILDLPFAHTTLSPFVSS